MRKNDSKTFQSDRVLSYFRAEWKALLAVTFSGLVYNLGLLAGPWFEGKMAGCLVAVLKGNETFWAMLSLVAGYVAAIAVVQICRYMKRFYVRRFANNVNRRMKEILYGSLVRKSKRSLGQEGEGDALTKAILDVDDCVEGMRKFTTEVFDTGVALAAYTGMLLWYDWRLALLCLIFPPVSYLTAEKMKKTVQRTGAAYKMQAGMLSTATLDRAQNEITYRVFGREKERAEAYEENLSSYEKAAVRASLWNAVMPPLYRIISMTGVLFILYFGQKNVLGNGWKAWDIAAFTTFLACFVKLSVKSSSAAKLFNAVHKAQVSWKRICPLLYPVEQEGTNEASKPGELTVEHVSFTYEDGKKILEDISFKAKPGQIIGITGPVACGKSTLGKAFLCEYPYEGQILFAGEELQQMNPAKRNGVVGYLGHDPELFHDTIENNILLGEKKQAADFLRMVSLDQEVDEMPEKEQTMLGTGNVRLSGGQAQRLALARTLCHKKPILVLDDPFSALDKKTERQVFGQLRREAEDGIVLLISHRLYLFPQLDQVIWLDHGKATVGTHPTLMEHVAEYAGLFREQEEQADEAGA